MITENELYWILKLDDIRSLLVGCTIVLSIISTVLIVITLVQVSDHMYIDSDWRRGRFARLAIYTALIASSIALALVPSTKQMAAIKAIPAIVNSDIAKDISSDTKELYKLGIDALKEKLTDTNSNKEK